MSHVEKKIKFLATKLTSLQSELKVSREIMTQASREVNEMFEKKYYPEKTVIPEKLPEDTDIADKNSDEGDEEVQTEEKQEEEATEEQADEKIENKSAEKKADPEVKRLFKKIASMTHPDKLSGLSKYERKIKEELFKKAMTALENNDLVSLADVAMDLDLETPDLSKEKLKETENKIIAIKQELHHIESTYVWKWFFCEDTEEKDKILTSLFGIMHANYFRS